MATATARMTFGSIFGLVATTAQAASSVVGTAVESVNMLDAYVKSAAQQQQARLAADMEDFESRIGEEKAQEMSQRQLQVDEFCNKSPRHKELFNANYQRIMKALEARKKGANAAVA